MALTTPRIPPVAAPAVLGVLEDGFRPISISATVTRRTRGGFAFTNILRPRLRARGVKRARIDLQRQLRESYFERPEPGSSAGRLGAVDALCKPCKMFLCIDGEWRAEDLDWPNGVCDGPNIDLGDDPFACPRSPEGFCPAECRFCF